MGELQAGHVLIVDDCDNNRDLLGRILRKAGYHTTFAEDGLQAIGIIASTGPQIDLVLLDWMMPGLSGEDVLRAMREHLDADELPIIMCTARDEGFAISAALAEGANDYVSKPFDREALLARVASQIKRKRLARAQKEDLERLEESLVERTRALAALTRDNAPSAKLKDDETGLALCLVELAQAAKDGDLPRVRELSLRALEKLQVQARFREVA